MSRVERISDETISRPVSHRSGEILEPLADLGPRKNFSELVAVGGLMLGVSVAGALLGERIVRPRMEGAERRINSLIETGISEETREVRRELLEEIRDALEIARSHRVVSAEDVLAYYNQAYDVNQER